MVFESICCLADSSTVELLCVHHAKKANNGRLPKTLVAAVTGVFPASSEKVPWMCGSAKCTEDLCRSKN